MHLGIDWGTSGVEAVVLDGAQRLIATAAALGGAAAIVCAAPKRARPFEPDPLAAALLASRYQHFRTLYAAQLPHFDEPIEELA